MVRATLSRRSWARADRPSRSTARARSDRAAGASDGGGAGLDGAELRVRALLAAGARPRPGAGDPLPHDLARLGARAAHQLLALEARHRHVEVDAVGHRAGQARAIGLGATGRAHAAAHGVAVEAARAGVAGADQQRAGREAGAHHRPGHVDAPLLQRLAQRVEGRRREGADLVQEQDPVVGQAHLARARDAPAAHEARGRDGVVRGAEGAAHDQGAAGVEQTRHRVDARHLDGLLQAQRGQDPGHPAGEHRLAAAGRPDHEHRVAARRGDLQRPPRGALAADLGEVRARRRRPPARAAPRRPAGSGAAPPAPRAGPPRRAGSEGRAPRCRGRARPPRRSRGAR